MFIRKLHDFSFIRATAPRFAIRLSAVKKLW